MNTRLDAYIRPNRPWYRTAPFYIVLAVVAIFLAVVLIAQVIGSDTAQEETAAQSTASDMTTADTADDQLKKLIERRNPHDPRAMGDVDAPVVMVEWTDLRCPFCGLFSREILPQIKKEYVDTGKVRVEFRDVVYFGDRSAAASAAARAAGEQGKYVDYINAVYARAPESGHPELPDEELIEIAEEIDIPDMARFKRDMVDPQLSAEVQSETDQARNLGVQGVPYFVAGSSALSGAQPMENFRSFLDQAIKEAD